MESLTFLSKARLKAENVWINSANDPEEIIPLVNRWLPEYINLTNEKTNQLSPIAQVALGTKYLLAQRISSICEERKHLQEILDSNPADSLTSSQTTNTASTRDIGNGSSISVNSTSATVASPNTANQLDDQPSTSRSCYITSTFPSNGNTEITYEHGYCADPRKRVLREMHREANLSGTSTSTNMQCADHAASSSRASVITSTENLHNSIVGSNNIRNVVNNIEESATTSSNNATESVAAYETVGSSTETGTANTSSAVSDGAVSMSTPTPALSPPMASSTPMPMTSPSNDKNAVRCTVIGPNGTKVPTERFNAISFTTGSAATRRLLCMIFTEGVLATHTLSGKSSPAFMGRKRQPKGQLDPIKVADIIHCVTSRTSCNENEVRMTITTKCADSTKKFRRLSRTMRRVN